MMSDNVSVDDLKGILKTTAVEIVKAMEVKQGEAIETLRGDVTKQIDALKGAVNEKAVMTGSGVKVVKGEEPTFLKSAGGFFQMVHSAATNSSDKNRLAEALEGHWKSITKAPIGSNTIFSSDGGFIPTAQIAQELKSSTYETGQLLSSVTSMPISGNNNRFVWNEVENEDRSVAGSFGGVTAYRVNEAAGASYSKPVVRQREIALSKMMITMAITEEMMADGAALGAWMMRNGPMAFNKKIDSEIIRGVGGNQCQGILTSPCVISVAKETGQTADTIVKENIEKMYDSLAPEYAAGAKWYINPHAHKELRNLVMAIGTAGSAVYLPEGSMVNQPHGTLLGLPVVRLNACSKLGDQGDIILANFKEYMVVEKGGVDMSESMHVLFLTAENVFRFTWRVNGGPLLSSQITPENANATDRLSAFVTLDARA